MTPETEPLTAALPSMPSQIEPSKSIITGHRHKPIQGFALMVALSGVVLTCLAFAELRTPWKLAEAAGAVTLLLSAYGHVPLLSLPNSPDRDLGPGSSSVQHSRSASQLLHFLLVMALSRSVYPSN
jgi:hypothetical protein